MSLPGSNPCNINSFSQLFSNTKDNLNKEFSDDSERVKYLKMEMVTQSHKRRRSLSHSGAEAMTIDYANDDSQFLSQSKDTSSDEPNFSNSLPNDSVVLGGGSWVKNKSKKETHNRVERKRRDFINTQIQKLSELLPQEYFINNDLKMNKGLILKNSVEYISTLKIVDSFNQHLLRETEFATKVIKLLLKSNDIKCPQLASVEDSLDNFQMIFNDWISMHLESQKMMQQITNSLSIFRNSLTENCGSSKGSKDGKMVGSQNIIGRKRYSSVPNNFEEDNNNGMGTDKFKNHKVNDGISEMNAPILDLLLKRKVVGGGGVGVGNSSSNADVDDAIRSMYKFESSGGRGVLATLANDEDMETYSSNTNVAAGVKYVTTTTNNGHLTAHHDINTDNAIIMNLANLDALSGEEKILRTRDKTYLILPKFPKSQNYKIDVSSSSSNSSNGQTTLDNGITISVAEEMNQKLLTATTNNTITTGATQYFMNINDPMLISTSTPSTSLSANSSAYGGGGGGSVRSRTVANAAHFISSTNLNSNNHTNNNNNNNSNNNNNNGNNSNNNNNSNTNNVNFIQNGSSTNNILSATTANSSSSINHQLAIGLLLDTGNCSDNNDSRIDDSIQFTSFDTSITNDTNDSNSNNVH